MTFPLTAPVLLTACVSQPPTPLTDEQITQRIVNYNIIQVCSQKGYFTPQELSHAYSVFPTATGGVNLARSKQIAASMPMPQPSSNECQKVRRAAQQSMTASAQKQQNQSTSDSWDFPRYPRYYTSCTTYSGITNCVNY